MNVPFVKKFDENGNIINFPKGGVKNAFPNRKERRKKLKKVRFHGESKNNHLTVFNNHKFRRVKQSINLKNEKGEFTGETKIIEHYLTN